MKLGFLSFESKLIITSITLASLFLNINALYAHQRECGFIMLKLHWSKGKISLDSIKEVKGLFENQRRIIKSKSYFFKVISYSDESILSDYFEIPFNLHYDSFNSINESIEGGSFIRSNLYFVIKLPYIDQIKDIRFYKQNSMFQINRHSLAGQQFIEEGATFLGSVSLQSFLLKDEN